MGRRPTPFPFSTGPARRLPGRGARPPPSPSAEVTGGGAHVPPLAVVTSKHQRCSDDLAGPRARRAARGSAEGAVSAGRARRVREAKWSGREPRAGQGPGGGTARIRGGAKTTAATVIEGRETRDPSRAHEPDMRSGEVRAASRVDPRRRRRTRV
jgi:hypothetical protein